MHSATDSAPRRFQWHRPMQRWVSALDNRSRRRSCGIAEQCSATTNRGTVGLRLTKTFVRLTLLRSYIHILHPQRQEYHRQKSAQSTQGKGKGILALAGEKQVKMGAGEENGISNTKPKTHRQPNLSIQGKATTRQRQSKGQG